MTITEAAFFQCAQMILFDQCPPESKYYLCMKDEDDSIRDCTQCWSNYLWGISIGTIKLPRPTRRATV